MIVVAPRLMTSGMETLKMRRYMMAVAGEMWIMGNQCRKCGGQARSLRGNDVTVT
jgi:hypothetical protein